MIKFSERLDFFRCFAQWDTQKSKLHTANGSSWGYHLFSYDRTKFRRVLVFQLDVKCGVYLVVKLNPQAFEDKVD